MPYDVKSITSGSFSGGSGCLTFFPDASHFDFIPESFIHYKRIRALLLRGATGGDTWMHGQAAVYGWILDSRREAKISVEEAEGVLIYYRRKIKAYSCPDGDNCIRFQYDDKNVEVIFAEKEGLEAMIETLSEVGIHPNDDGEVLSQ